MKTVSIENQVGALNALQSRLSEGSFATETLTRLTAAASALGDVITACAKTADTPERKAQRISAAGNLYLAAVNRTKADLTEREFGGLAALNLQFADRVNLSIEGYRWAAQITDTFRAASQTERVTMLAQIVESGDGRALASLLEAPPYVHGVDLEMLQRYRSAMEKKFAPDITEKRERFDLDLEVTHTALQAAEQIAKIALKVENVSETLAGAEAARDAEQRLQDAIG